MTAREPPLRLDEAARCLWRRGEEVSIPPRPFALLRYMLEHPGVPLDRESLMDDVWSGVKVSGNAIRFAVAQLRKALDDSAETPRFVETVPRRGWKFVGHAIRAGPSAWLLEPAGCEGLTPSSEPSPGILVGREDELAVLHQCLAAAESGSRQLVFVWGEAGIGKTALVSSFLSRVGSPPRIFAGRGQGIEHSGPGEPYMPILEAMARLCAEVGGSAAHALLRQYAPMWLSQLPALSSPEERAALRRETQGASQERMIREFASALEVLSADRTLVLWIDDLHWSDDATLELLSFLARRQEPARLLILGTHRPAAGGIQAGSLASIRRDLEAHGRCRSLALGLLDRRGIEAYVAERFGLADPSRAQLSRFLHDRTEGNPLFMVGVANDLVDRGVVAAEDGRWALRAPLDAVPAPTGVQQILNDELERLRPEDRELLEVASVAGMEFSAAALEAALEADLAEIEERCQALARKGRFLMPKGTETWPDGTIASRLGFLHALHREVLDARLPEGRRARLHRAIRPTHRVCLPGGRRGGRGPARPSFRVRWRDRARWATSRWRGRSPRSAMPTARPSRICAGVSSGCGTSLRDPSATGWSFACGSRSAFRWPPATDTGPPSWPGTWHASNRWGGRCWPRPSHSPSCSGSGPSIWFAPSSRSRAPSVRSCWASPGAAVTGWLCSRVTAPWGMRGSTSASSRSPRRSWKAPSMATTWSPIRGRTTPSATIPSCYASPTPPGRAGSRATRSRPGERASARSSRPVGSAIRLAWPLPWPTPPCCSS